MTPIDQDSQGSKIKNFQGPINIGAKGQIKMDFPDMRNIRTVYNRAIDDGVANLNDYPFRRFKIKQEKTRKRALTVEQLRELRDYPCEEFQRQFSLFVTKKFGDLKNLPYLCTRSKNRIILI